MIHVARDYDDVPEFLKSHLILAGTTGAVTFEMLYAMSVDRYTGDGLGELIYDLYSGKCSCCEIQLNFPHYKNILFYRPESIYHWLVTEWSNFLPVCLECRDARNDRFPLADDGVRVTEPQKDRNQWRADSESFLAEKPLLLNPELDEPQNHLAFYPDGRIYGLTERGKTTIDIFKLNRTDLVERRRSVVGEFERQLNFILPKVASLQTGKDETTILRLLFEKIFNSLEISTESFSPFALLGRCMERDFDTFFIEPLAHEPQQQELLRKVKDIFLPGKPKTTGAVTTDIPVTTAEALKPVKATVDGLEINNIKCFDHSQFPLNGNSTLILGTNGRGKSTVLQLLALGLSGLERPPYYGDWRKVTKMGRDKGIFKINLSTSEGPLQLEYSIGENDTVKGTKNDAYERLKSSLLILAYGHGRNLSSQPTAPYKNYEEIASLFGNTGYLKKIKDSTVYTYVSAGFTEIKELVNRIFALAEKENAVQLDTFDTESFYFKTPTALMGGVPLEAMSDGFRSTFMLVFDMVVRAWEKGADMKKPQNIAGVVMIDEIDLHLHPSWQRTFLPTLFTVFPGLQFIITSHSPFIVQSMNSADIITLSMDGEGAVARKVEMDGKPYGQEIDKIIKDVLGEEQKIPEVSDRLYGLLMSLVNAVKAGDKESATLVYGEIKSAIPSDSGLTEYIDTMSAGLVAPGVEDD